MNNKTILVVDDDPDIREFISYNLIKKGFNVLEAENGEIAFETAMIRKPHLILMDIMMPVMNGFDACRKLRENSFLDSTYIILLSAMSEGLARTAGHNIFIDDFISKPIAMKDLLNRINKVLEQ